MCEGRPGGSGTCQIWAVVIWSRVDVEWAEGAGNIEFRDVGRAVC